MNEATSVVTFPELCDLEWLGDRSHELVGGRVYAIAGGTERHRALRHLDSAATAT